MIVINRPYLTGNDVAEALIAAGVEVTLETAWSYRFNDVADQLTRTLNQRMLRFLEPVTKELEQQAGTKTRSYTERVLRETASAYPEAAI